MPNVQPYNLPKEITIEVTLLESALIKKLRQYPYGEFRVIKMNGEPTRIISEGSEMLKENEGLSLAIDFKKE